MNLLQTLIGAGLRPHVRRKARGKSLTEVRAGLESSLSAVLLPRIERVEDTAANRETLNHWLGIERWSLARVRVALGEPFVEGSYHAYRLSEGASWSELKAGFLAARASTVASGREPRTERLRPGTNRAPQPPWAAHGDRVVHLHRRSQP